METTNEIERLNLLQDKLLTMEQPLKHTDFLEIAPTLRSALRSPFSSVRLAALQLMVRLCSSSSTSSVLSAFSIPLKILLEAEQCPTNFEHYRLRAQILRRLKHTSLRQMLPDVSAEEGEKEDTKPVGDVRAVFDKMVLDWLLAQFYERLTLYWPLLTEPIESFAQAMPADAFWDCFGQALDQAWGRWREKQQQKQAENDGEEEAKSSGEVQPDYASYRVQLLRLLSKLPSAANAEKKTRFLAPKFIQLYSEEFMQVDELVTTTSIARPGTDETTAAAVEEEEEQSADDEEEEGEEEEKLEEDDEEEELDEVVGDEEEEDEEGDEDDDEEQNDEEKKNRQKEEEKRQRKKKKENLRKVASNKQRPHRPLSFHTRRPGTMHALKAMLALFGRFTNPLGVYREPEIRQIYYELLLVNDPEIQRLALGCLYCYKHSWLTPYRDSLEGLLDEKNLRDHLVLFSVDAQQTAAMGTERHGRSVGKQATRAVPLLDQHRAQLMPILLRLLYGALHTHVAHRGRAKRMAIFRFLANCLPQELALFLRILFGPLISLFEFSPENDTDVDTEKTLLALDGKRAVVEAISLNKLKSLLGTLAEIFRFLGPALDDAELQMLFTALLVAGRIALLRDRWMFGNAGNNISNNEESTPLGRQLKNLRLLCVQILAKFLTIFHPRPDLPIAGLHCLFPHFLAPLIAAKGKPFALEECEKTTSPLMIALPASVCRIFCAWTKIPRYHALLNVPFTIHLQQQQLPNNKTTAATTTIAIETTPFALLCQQLLHFAGDRSDGKQRGGGGRQTPVHVEILRVCCALLDSSPSNEPMDTEHFPPLASQMPQAELQALSSEEEITAIGPRLVLTDSSVDTILAHLSRVIRGGTPSGGVEQQQQKATAAAAATIGRIPPVYFDLLNRLSAHIHRTDVGALFAHTLLHYIANKRGRTLRRQRVEKAQNLLATLTNLSVHLEQPMEAISCLAPLFSNLDGRLLREPLTRLLSSLKLNARLPAGAHELLEILDELESWDSRRIAEPNADDRCKAMSSLHVLYEKGNNEKEKEASKKKLLPDGSTAFLALFAHSHAHSMMKSTDLSLRGIAASCFRQLISFVATNRAVTEGNIDKCKLLHSHLIPLTMRGLKIGSGEEEDGATGNESIRHEFIQCLVRLLLAFPTDPHLSPLRAIGGATLDTTTGDDGEEVISDQDFFACAMHIQAHKRQRAFYRLAERLNSGELKIGHLPLLQYIVPIVSPYLMDIVGTSRSALSDQALCLFTAILKRVPWPKYQKILEQYLRQLDKQEEQRTKAAIRVIIAVLDAFHFDLRSCQQVKLTANFSALKLMNDEKHKQKDGEDDEAMDEDELPPEEVENAIPDSVKPEDTMKGRQRIFAVVASKLLPRLRELLNPQRQMHSHRRAQQFAANAFQYEDDKLLRAPLVIAAVKLFKWLPEHCVNANLNNFLLALNHLLMSRSASVRQGARKLMVQVIRLLGPKQLPFVVCELKQTMNRGFQIHVMVFTVHTLIQALEQQLQPGDLDGCLRELIEVCKWQTFGSSQLEQEQKQHQQHQNAGEMVRSDSHGVPEARASNKTSETFTQIGRFMGSEQQLEDTVLHRIREIVEASPKAETLRKLSEWLRALSVGLRYNNNTGSGAGGGIPAIRQFHFAYRLANTTLRQMVQDQERLGGATNASGSANKKVGVRPPSCLLLPPEPKRLGVIQKVSVKSRVHIFMEFALQMLADQLKAHSVGGRKAMAAALAIEEVKEEESNEADEAQLEPTTSTITMKNPTREARELQTVLEQFVPVILDAMRQKYDKVVALCLHSLLYLLKYPLQALRERQTELLDRLFAILADYASMGQAGNRPAVLELQQNLFKCFTQVIRDAPDSVLLQGNRMQLLLNYAETDILDTHKQATAFNLVKAIIGRRIDDEKMGNMIEYLSEMAITSLSANIRSQCRQVVLLYLTVHPRGQRTYEQWMEFFLNQTEYELEDGRLSALEMVHAMLHEFTEEANSRYALLVHMKLSARLLNDESEKCRQFVGHCLRKLLCSVTASAFNDLHAATGDWLAARKPSIRLLAWRAFAQFVQSGSPFFTDSHVQKLAQRVCNEFATRQAEEFGKELSTPTKRALCELLQAIAEKGPAKLDEALLTSGKATTKKMAKRKKGRAGTRKNKGGGADEEEEIVDEQALQKFRQFFENLQQCLLSCRLQSSSSSTTATERMQLSVAAAAFLSQWLAQPSSREAVIRGLKIAVRNAEKEEEEEAQIPANANDNKSSPLCSLCLSIVALLDPSSTGAAGQNREKRGGRRSSQTMPEEKMANEEEEQMDEVEDEIKEEVEEEDEKLVAEKEGGGEKDQINIADGSAEGEDAPKWDDTLADLSIRLLVHLSPALEADQFEIVARKLARICWTEAAKEPDKARKRLCIFKLIGALAMKCPVDSPQFGQVCTRFLPLLYREMSKKSIKFTEELYSLASEVADQFRKQLGNREFSARLAQCQRERAERKQQRRQQAKFQLVSNPVAAIEAKQKRHLRKRAAKARRLDAYKPYRAIKRRRREEAIKRAASPIALQ